jgi:hypothetical protein
LIRFICLTLLGASAAWAQSASTPAVSNLAALEQTARQRADDWNKLAQALEPGIARLLPCDPKVISSISEVSRASDMRLAALIAYLQSAAQKAAADVENVRNATPASLTAELDAEKTEAMSEQAAVDSQLISLQESAKVRAALADAVKALQQVSGLVKQRSGIAQTEVANQSILNSSISTLVSALKSREDALRAHIITVQAERSRWNSYYAARLARAQTECTVIKGGSAADAAPTGSTSATPARPNPASATGSKSTSKSTTQKKKQ